MPQVLVASATEVAEAGNADLAAPYPRHDSASAQRLTYR